jgi:hypothetical protein
MGFLYLYHLPLVCLRGHIHNMDILVFRCWLCAGMVSDYTINIVKVIYIYIYTYIYIKYIFD